jgi:hypothetical protein
MAEDILRLEVGDVLQLQVISPDKDDRYSVAVIGYLPGESVLVTAPTIEGKVQFVREDQRFAVRMLRGSHVYGFVAKVLHVAIKPFPYLHLSFPDEVESITVRDADRVETEIPALVRNTNLPDEQGSWQPVYIRDLSTTGARLESITPLGREGEMMRIRFQLEVCEAEEEIDLLADIRNQILHSSNSDDKAHRYITGTRFHTLNRYQKLLLHDHVLEQRVIGD